MDVGLPLESMLDPFDVFITAIQLQNQLCTQKRVHDYSRETESFQKSK